MVVGGRWNGTVGEIGGAASEGVIDGTFVNSGIVDAGGVTGEDINVDADAVAEYAFGFYTGPADTVKPGRD